MRESLNSPVAEPHLPLKSAKPDFTTLSFIDLRDADLFAKVYQELFTPLVRYAKTLFLNDLEASDIASESLLKLWNMNNRFPDYASLKSYAYTIVRNSCIDHLRRVILHKRIHKNIGYSADSFFSPAHDNNDCFDANYADYKKFMCLGMQTLPEKCLEIFKLIYIEDRSLAEIACMLNINVQTVRNQKTKAVNALREFMVKKGVTTGYFKRRKPKALKVKNVRKAETCNHLSVSVNRREHFPDYTLAASALRAS